MAGISVDFPELEGSSVRVGIVKARWHEKIGDALIADAKKAMIKCGVEEENIIESEVPGSFELPLAARFLALSGTVDVILPVGVLIKGDTVRASRQRATPAHTAAAGGAAMVTRAERCSPAAVRRPRRTSTSSPSPSPRA